MDQKIIVGVKHGDEKELEALKKELSTFAPSSVGLELPQDYVEKQEYGVSIFFFSDLAAHYVDNGARVIPLEDPRLFERSGDICLAKNMLTGEADEEKIRLEMQRLKERYDSPFMAPELTLAPMYFVERYRAGIELLALGMDELSRLWKECNQQREDYVLRKILEHEPDIVILGDAHVRNLIPKLPAYHLIHEGEHETSCSEESSQ